MRPRPVCAPSPRLHYVRAIRTRQTRSRLLCQPPITTGPAWCCCRGLLWRNPQGRLLSAKAWSSCRVSCANGERWMSDDANDVTKALAAFGAPSIRYHSFGQAQIKPSSVVLPRRVAPPAPEEEQLAPAQPVQTQPAPTQPLPTRQDEPVAAVEHAQLRPLAASPPLAPLVQTGVPFPRQPEPPRQSPPTVAPPPRPLAEWAAPVTPTAPRPIVTPQPLVRSSTQAAPPSFPPTPPAPVALPPLIPMPGLPIDRAVAPAASAMAAPTPPPRARPAPALVEAVPPEHEPISAAPSQKPSAPVASRSLQEIFDFLMSGSSKAGPIRT